MYRLDIKPLSVNESYQGRRFRTKKLLLYQEIVSYKLPKTKVPKGKIKVWYIFGLSSKNADLDNHIKAFQDCIADKYGFNDKNIYMIFAYKIDVKKGEEFIEFNIEKYGV